MVESQCLDVLIVDDQPGVRYLLDIIVREEGHRPFQAVNGQEAVDKVRKINPQLVFMDIRMPVMDGATALKKIREMGYNCQVVVMTSFIENDVIDKVRNNGAVKCIIKPFDTGEIRQIINDVFRLKKCIGYIDN